MAVAGTGEFPHMTCVCHWCFIQIPVRAVASLSSHTIQQQLNPKTLHRWAPEAFKRYHHLASTVPSHHNTLSSSAMPHPFASIHTFETDGNFNEYPSYHFFLHFVNCSALSLPSVNMCDNSHSVHSPPDCISLPSKDLSSSFELTIRSSEGRVELQVRYASLCVGKLL